MIYITAIISAILTLLYIKQSLRVMELRKIHKVRTGHGGKDVLERAIHAHENFSEYVPIGLLLLVALEVNGAPQISVIVVGCFLIVGRYFHAVDVADVDAHLHRQVIGVKVTLVALALGALSNIIWVAYSLLTSVRFAANLYIN